MIHRRRFLLGSGAMLAATTLPAAARAAQVLLQQPSNAGENLPDYVRRIAGGWDETLYSQLLGAANEFKEGDEIEGVSAADDAARQQARQLLGRTTLAQIIRRIHRAAD